MNRVLVTIEAENRCQLSSATAAEVRVTQVSCVSREWSIKKMDRGQGDRETVDPLYTHTHTHTRYLFL